MKVIEIPCLGGMEYPIGGMFKFNYPEMKILAGEFLKIWRNATVVNIFCMGSSGTIVATAMAIHLQPMECNILYIPKDGEVRHETNPAEAAIYEHRRDIVNIMVDDHIASGFTINTMYTKLREINKGIKIHGIFVSGVVHLFKISDIKTDYLVCGSYYGNIDPKLL